MCNAPNYSWFIATNQEQTLVRQPLMSSIVSFLLHCTDSFYFPQISQNLSVIPKMEKAKITQYLSLLTDEKVLKVGKGTGFILVVGL